MSIYKNKTLLLNKNKKKTNILSSIYENDSTESIESIARKKYKLNNNKFNDKSNISTSSFNLKLNSSFDIHAKKSNNSSKITPTKKIGYNIKSNISKKFQLKNNLNGDCFRYTTNIIGNKKITPSKNSFDKIDLQCKENKENQVTLVFNNSLLNNYYFHNRISFLNCTQVNNQFLHLNCPYDPHLNYLKITNNKKDLAKTFVSQTKNNFFNQYQIIYSSVSHSERKCIMKSFETIKNDKSKNIDEHHNIKNIVNKAINKYGKNLFLRANNLQRRNEPIVADFISTPSFINTNEIFKRNSNVNIKSLKFANESFKNYMNNIYNHNNFLKKEVNKINSAINVNNSKKNTESNFFQTLPKNLPQNRNGNITDFINENQLL